LAQQSQGEYDDLYFTSKDREQALTASASSSSVQYDQMEKADDASAQQNANPDYVATHNRRQNNRNGDAYNAGDNYYDESYADRRRFGSIRPSVAGGVYSSPAYYDPFFSPYGYDSYYARNAYSSFYYDPFFSYRPHWGFRPGISVSISYNTWGRPWGWNSWGYDPFWNAGPWGGYNAWNSWGYDPFWGGGYAYGPVYNNYFYGGGWNGGGWNRPWYGGNTVNVGNGGNGGRDNNTYRNYGRRGEGRGSEVISEQNNGAPARGNTPGRGGRVDGSGDVNRNPDATAYPGYTRPQRVSTPDSYRDRGGNDPGQNGGRTSSPDVITTRPAGSSTNDGFARPTRPRSSDYSTGDNGSQRSSTYYNNDNNPAPSRPTYSAPRNDSWGGGSNSGGGNSGGYSRPSRSDNGSFGGSSPAPAPSGGRSSGYSGGGSSSGSSNGGGGSSGGYTRPPRN
jgi:hypothetical protein